MLTNEQLLARKTGLGGSDVAAIFGLSKWDSPMDIYLEKILPPEMLPDEPTEEMIWGQLLEDAIAGEYARRQGVKVARVSETLRHKALPQMLANIDRRVLVERPQRGLEVKTASPRNKAAEEAWGEPGTEEVPDVYWMQCQHYMEVTGWDRWDLAVLLRGNKMQVYTITRNVEMGARIREAVAMFWDQFVVPRVPPPLKGGELAELEAAALKQLYPGTDGSVVDLSDYRHWHEVLEDVEEKIKRWGILRRETRNHLTQAMGQASVGTIPGLGEYRRKLVDRAGYAVEPTSYVDFRFSKAKK